MKLERVFDQLRYGTLKGQAIAREGAEIQEIDYPRLISCINIAMLKMYGRFKLKYSEVFIRLVSGKYIYRIHSDYSEANTDSTELLRWIADVHTGVPYKDDLVRVHAVTTSDGTSLAINDSADCFSIMTPSYDSIQIPIEVANICNALSVTYEASPLPIEASTTIDPSVAEVDIPDYMLECLCYYTASKFMEQSTAQDKVAKATEFLSKFEKTASELELYGMVNTEYSSNTNVGVNVWP